MRWSCLLAGALVVACAPADAAPLAPAVARPVLVEPTPNAIAKQILVPTPTVAVTQLAPSAPAPTTAPTLLPTIAPAVAPTRTPVATPSPYDAPLFGPVIDKDYPDPALLVASGAFYAFATNANGRNVQASISTDLVHWRDLPDALPALPSWARPGFTWAPEVARIGDGYVMYFTARHSASGRQCIGAAIASTPAGPYRPRGDVPLVCEPEFGGSIDPYPFLDADGTRYLVWKTDSNAIGTSTVIKTARMARDGLSFLTTPVALIANDLPWEGAVVEAPTLVRRGDTYVLFYSANDYAGAAYAVGVATASSLEGPWVKSPRPILASGDGRVGPGGESVATVGDDTWMLYHAWSASGAYRDMRVARIAWDGARPTVVPATTSSLARVTP